MNEENKTTYTIQLTQEERDMFDKALKISGHRSLSDFLRVMVRKYVEFKGDV